MLAWRDVERERQWRQRRKEECEWKEGKTRRRRGADERSGEGRPGGKEEEEGYCRREGGV